MSNLLPPFCNFVEKKSIRSEFLRFLAILVLYSSSNSYADSQTFPVATDSYCVSPVTHFNIDGHAGSILLSVENSGADSVTVTATSPDNVIDVLLVQSVEGGGIASDTTIVDGVATAEITWANGKPAITSFNLLWSDEESPGNYMLFAGDAENGLGNIDTSNDCPTDHPVPVPVVPATANVTFSVDMTGVDLQGQVPTLNGTFNGWCGDCNPMSDDDGDGVWTVTVNIDQGYHEYKYAIGAWVSEEAVPYNCSNTIGTNRNVTVDGDLTLPTDVYSGCPVGDTTGNTGGNTNSATYCATEVTHFNIDGHPDSILLSVENSGADSMTVTATSPNDVIDVLLVQSVEGGGTASAASIVNGVATAEITWAAGTMPATTSFMLLWSDEASPGNQMLDVGDGHNAIGYISTADVCTDDHPVPAAPVAPTKVNVTFQVDMDGVDTSTGVSLMGGAVFGLTGLDMSDADGDNVWTVTTELDIGSTVAFKYRNTTELTWDGQEPVSGSCAFGQWNDRQVEVADSDMTLDVVAFGSCDATAPAGNTDPAPVATTTYCATEVTHFNIDNHPGSILLSVENSGADSMTVTATSVSDVIDVLLVQSVEGGGTASATTVANGVATSEITWAAGTMPATTSFTLLWSDEASGGNQMVNAGGGDDGLGYINTAKICSIDINFVAFGGANISEGSVYTFPSYAEQWAGFNTVDSLNTIKFNESGSISFSAYVPSGEIVDVRFRLEKKPWPDTEPSFETEHVTVSGTEISEYTVNVPALGALEFSSLIMYLNTRDEPVSISNVVVHASSLQSSVNELEPVAELEYGSSGLPLVFGGWHNDYTYGDIDSAVVTELDPSYGNSLGGLKYIKDGDLESSGIWISVAEPIDFSLGYRFYSRIYSTVSREINFGFSYSGISRSAVHSGEGWQTLEFDFSGEILDDNQTKITITNEPNIQGDGGDDWTIYIEGIAQESYFYWDYYGPDFRHVYQDDKVMPLFGGETNLLAVCDCQDYTESPCINNSSSWDYNSSLFIGNYNEYGEHVLQLSEPIDISEYDFFRLDFYFEAMRSASIFLIDSNNNEKGYKLNFKDAHMMGFEIPLSMFDGIDLSTVNRIKVISEGEGYLEFYNWYFVSNHSVFSGITNTPAVMPLTFDSSQINYQLTASDGAEVVRENLHDFDDRPSQLKYVKNNGEASAGISIDLDASAKGTKFFSNIYSNTPREITLRFDDAGIERTATHSGSGWETLSFDFNQPIPINQTRLSIINEKNIEGTGGPEWTIYIDRIYADLSHLQYGSEVDYGFCQGQYLNEDTVDVTFQVDMTGIDTTNGVSVMGGAIFGQAGLAMSDDDGDTIWTVTTTLDQNSTVNFKYRNTTAVTWDGQEPVAGDCTVGEWNDRHVTTVEEDIVLDVVAFGSCSTDTYVPPSKVNVTFQVDMSTETVSADGVYLAGGNFGQDGHLLTDQGNGIWSVTLDLEASTTYMYKFRNRAAHGTWEGFEDQDGLIAGGCGVGPYSDRFVFVGEDNLVLPVVPYSGCGSLDDSSSGDDSSGDTVFTVAIDGTPTSVRMVSWIWQGWDPNQGPVAEDNGDGTWSVAMTIEETFEYLWVVDGVQESLVDNAAAGECEEEVNSNAFNTDYNSYANRMWNFGDGDAFVAFDACALTSLSDSDQDGIIDINDPDDDNDGVNDELDSLPYDPNFSVMNEAAFIYQFGGTTKDDENHIYTHPIDAQIWAGYANGNEALYPITLSEDLLVVFTASVPEGGNADVRFMLENEPYPNNTVVVDSTVVTVSGATEATYTAAFDSQGGQEFHVLLMYLDTRDTDVMIKDVFIVAASNDDSDADGVVDSEDAFPNDPTESIDTDLDGIGNNADTDDDNDGVPDTEDSNPLAPSVGGLPQQIVTVKGTPSASLGSSVNVVIEYDVSNNESELPGLGLNVHYDSSALTFIEFADVFVTDNISSGGPFNDDDDLDGNSVTDKYIKANWASLYGNWPGELPVELLNLVFNVAGEILVESTTIGFSSISNAASYIFAPTAYDMPIPSGSLDFDEDGNVDALTDGLLLLRYAFGLRGDKLADNSVVAAGSNLTVQQIQRNLEDSESILDIDNNGTFDALTDGLMLLRYLFGLRGDQLTIQAIAPNANRLLDHDIEAHIQRFMPL